MLEADADAVGVVCVSQYITDLEMVESMRKRGLKNLVLALIDDSLAGYKSFSDFMNAGADDAQPLSIDPAELKARIATLIRRAQPPETPWLVRVGPATLNTSTGWMSSDLGSVHLTGSEAEALCLLVQKAGAVVTKEMFCTHLYKGMADEPGTKIVDVYVCKLRKKLLPICDGRDIIETVWGRGFRYVAAGIEPKFTDARVRAAG